MEHVLTMTNLKLKPSLFTTHPNVQYTIHLYSYTEQERDREKILFTCFCSHKWKYSEPFYFLRGDNCMLLAHRP